MVVDIIGSLSVFIMYTERFRASSGDRHHLETAVIGHPGRE